MVNLNSAPRFHIWFSVNARLFTDAERDIRTVCGSKLALWDVFTLRQKLAGMNAFDSTDRNKLVSMDAWLSVQHQLPAVVLYITYSKVVFSANKDPKGLDWVWQLMRRQSEGAGVIALDEGHRAKNLVPRRTQRGEWAKETTKTAKEVFAIQSAHCLGAKIVYSSATAATEPQHLGYMIKLGLWDWEREHHRRPSLTPSVDPSVPRSFGAFENQLQQSGFAGMRETMVTLRRAGRCSCRSLSLEGVEAELYPITLAADSIVERVRAELAKSLLEIWMTLRIHLNSVRTEMFSVYRAAAKYPGCNDTSDARNLGYHLAKTRQYWYSYFWSAFLRIMRTWVMSAKLDAVETLTKKALDENCQVVIALSQTGAAAMERFVGIKGDAADAARQQRGGSPLSCSVLASSSGSTAARTAAGRGRSALALTDREIDAVNLSLVSDLRVQNTASGSSASNNSNSIFSSAATATPRENTLSSRRTGERIRIPNLELVELKGLVGKVLLKSEEADDLGKRVDDRFAALECQAKGNPLDQLFHDLGGQKKVAEISGRRRRWQQAGAPTGLSRASASGSGAAASSSGASRGGGGVFRFEYLDRPNNESQTAVDDFQDGKKRVVIISEAGSTGKSLHAERRGHRPIVGARSSTGGAGKGRGKRRSVPYEAAGDLDGGWSWPSITSARAANQSKTKLLKDRPVVVDTEKRCFVIEKTPFKNPPINTHADWRLIINGAHMTLVSTKPQWNFFLESANSAAATNFADACRNAGFTVEQRPPLQNADARPSRALVSRDQTVYGPAPASCSSSSHRSAPHALVTASSSSAIVPAPARSEIRDPRSGSDDIVMRSSSSTVTEDPRRRVMITAQFPYAADLCAQQMGRVNRAGQMSAPKYTIPVLTQLPGEKRFMSVLVKRFKLLGATCHAHEDAHLRTRGLQELRADCDLHTAFVNRALTYFLSDFLSGVQGEVSVKDIPAARLAMYKEDLPFWGEDGEEFFQRARASLQLMGMSPPVSDDSHSCSSGGNSVGRTNSSSHMDRISGRSGVGAGWNFDGMTGEEDAFALVAMDTMHDEAEIEPEEEEDGEDVESNPELELSRVLTRFLTRSMILPKIEDQEQLVDAFFVAMKYCAEEEAADLPIRSV